MEQNQKNNNNMKSSAHFNKDLNAMLRWAVNVHLWNPSVSEFETLLHRIPKSEQECCLSFKFTDDRKRALVSRLLQRKAASVVLKIPYSKVEIRKTKGRKPFVFNARGPSHEVPNFNFNVAHEGRYAVLVSEPVCLCGVDISAPQQFRRNRNHRLISDIMERVCTQHEIRAINTVAKTDNETASLFRRHWALKEAFVKARGDGIAYGLKNAEFCFDESVWSSNARLRVDGVRQTNWGFHLHELGDSHWVAVAKGPPDSCIDQYGVLRSTFQKLHLTDNELQAELQTRESSFEEKEVMELIS